MEDTELARVVARDLVLFLDSYASKVDGPVFAIALWADDQGYFGVSLGTEAWYERQRSITAYRDWSEVELSSSCFRWHSGNWDIVAREFLSPEVEGALDPLKTVLCDPSTEEEAYYQTVGRWYEIAVQAVRQVQPPPSLPTSPDLLLYTEYPGATCIEHAEAILQTVPPARFHEVMPVWRETARAVRAAQADERIMDQLRRYAADPPQGARFFPLGTVPAPDEFSAQLRACGLGWDDVLTDSGNLHSVLAIADRD